MATPQVSHEDARVASALCGGPGVLRTLLRRAIALLPRRVAEPTGPFDVLIDLLLGLVIARGASTAQLAALPVDIVAQPGDADDRCAICIAPFEQGDHARVLHCSHRFHLEVSFPNLHRRYSNADFM